MVPNKRKECRFVRSTMIMKRFIVVFLIVVGLFVGVTCAAEENASNQIFINLANIYDSSLNYLHERQITWDHLLDAKVKDAGERWFVLNIVTSDGDRARAIYGFTTVNGYGDPYTDLFCPLLDFYGHTDEGLQKAAFAFTSLIFYDATNQDKLEEQKQAIKELKTTEPDYEYIKELQELYKKTSQIADYTINSTDSYVNTSARISEFEQIRRDQKSEFEFDFDWPDYDYINASMDNGFGSIIKAWHQAKDNAKEEAYQKAVSIESTGKYKSAWELFASLGDYKDSNERARTNAELLMENAAAIYKEIYYDKNGNKASKPFGGYDIVFSRTEGSNKVEITYWEDDRDVKEKESYTIKPGETSYTGTKTGAWSRSSGTKWSKSKDTYSSKTEYDSRQNLVKETKTFKAETTAFKSSDGKVVVYTYKYTYDDNGRIIKQEEYENNAHKRTYTFEYKYDEYGRVTESTRVTTNASGTKSTQVSKYIYENWLLVREEHEMALSEGTIVRTEYKYGE